MFRGLLTRLVVGAALVGGWVPGSLDASVTVEVTPPLPGPTDLIEIGLDGLSCVILYAEVERTQIVVHCVTAILPEIGAVAERPGFETTVRNESLFVGPLDPGRYSVDVFAYVSPGNPLPILFPLELVAREMLWVLDPDSGLIDVDVVVDDPRVGVPSVVFELACGRPGNPSSTIVYGPEPQQSGAGLSTFAWRDVPTSSVCRPGDVTFTYVRSLVDLTDGDNLLRVIGDRVEVEVPFEVGAGEGEE